MNELATAHEPWSMVLQPDERIDDPAAAPLPRGRMSLRIVAGRHGGKVYVYVPRAWRPGGPVLAAVHGISRNAREQVQMFSTWADRCGFAVVAPLFARDRYRDYQRLGLERGARRADEFMNAALDAFERWTGAPLDDLTMFGFSGGAQFAHRYALLNPDRLRALVLGAAGWYSMPDDAQPFPLGLGELPVPVDLVRDKWLSLPMLVVVGTDDTTRDDALRQTPHIDATQGFNRLERARRFVAQMRVAAAARGLDSRVEFALLPGVGHGFAESMRQGGLAEQALPFLGLIASPDSGVEQ